MKLTPVILLATSMAMAIGGAEEDFAEGARQAPTSDPQFSTWTGTTYDWHGECDLLFLHAPSFGGGVGLDIHIRTTIHAKYSFIENAAIRIGNDVFEVSSFGDYYFNGMKNADLDSWANLGGFPLRRYLSEEQEGDESDSIYFEIFVDFSQSIILGSFGEFVGVELDNASARHYRDSIGLLGDFVTGKRLGRDGKSEIGSDELFGLEWQINTKEPMLFHSRRPPHLGDGRLCKIAH
jgi:hypothetical protein